MIEVDLAMWNHQFQCSPYRDRGRHSGGAEPRERQIVLNSYEASELKNIRQAFRKQASPKAWITDHW